VEPPDVRDPDPTMLLAPGSEMAGPDGGPILYMVGEDQAVPVDGEITIGKTRGVDLKARGFWVKPVHARVKAEGPGAYRLSCQGGASVQLNGQPVSEAYLKAGDLLVVGRSQFRLTPNLASEPTGA